LLAALDSYLEELYPPESRHGLTIEALGGSNVRFVIAEQGDRVVGCGALRLDDTFAEIKRMYVVPEARKEGVGRRLLAHLEAAAAVSGRPLVRLETGVAQRRPWRSTKAPAMPGSSPSRPTARPAQRLHGEVGPAHRGQPRPGRLVSLKVMWGK
jgi:GNAT superfamily N-acetyltransferase